MDPITRRTFIAGATAVAAGGLAAFRQEETKPVGWAILGLGSYALGQIMPNMRFCKLSKPVALISGSPDKAKRVAGEYGIDESKIYSYDNLEAIADDPDIEVVYVITPPGTHAEFTIRALEAGKHVCCEKPMASSSDECRRMIATAQRMNRRLQIGYRCHFEPHNLEAMRICRTGEGIGPLRTIRSEHGFTLGPSQWHLDPDLGGFGAISEIGVYAIQAMCYLAGEDPVEVWGSRYKSDPDRFVHTEDVNHFNLLFPSGVMGIGSTAYSWNANNFRAYGQFDLLDAEPATGYGGHRFSLRRGPIEVEPGNQWAGQMDHLSECVRDPNKTLIAPGEMGLRDIRIIEAILKSADEGVTVKL